MKITTLSLASLAFAAGAAFSLIGCESQSSAGYDDNYSGTAPHAHPGADYHPKTAAKAEAPKAAAKAEAPKAAAAAPAPKAAATTGNVQYFPTGDRNSSALMLEKIYPAQVTVGQPFDYVIKATNIGGATLNNVLVNEAAPTNFTVASVTPTGANGQYNLGNLNPGESKTITFKGSAAGLGTIASCASATYSLALCSTINVVQPALAISKTITPEAILNCTPINMTVEVKNTGSGVASNVHVKDTLPAGLTLDNGQTSFDDVIGDLAPGASKTVSKTLKATKTGSYDNVANATADGNLNVTSNKVTTVVKQPVLAIECKPGSQAMVGRDACYDLTVRNTGNAVSKNTKVAVTLPAGATVSNAGNGTASAGSLVFSGGDLAPGATQTMRFCLKAASIAPLNISAVLTGDCAAQVATNCTINVYGVADIGTTVTDEDGVVALGEPHSYQVEVKNQGQIPLTNTKMTVTIPAGLEFVSSPLAKMEGGKLVFNFGTVAPGAVMKSSFIAKATKSGELLVIGETTCAEVKTPVRDDELTTFIEK